MMRYFLIFACFAPLFSCYQESVVDIELDDYENEIVMECYLKDGEPVKLVLSQSEEYFSPEFRRLVERAAVKVTANGRKIILENKNYLDKLEGKRYNYVSKEIVRLSAGDAFAIYISDTLGRKLHGKTTALPEVGIEKVSYQYHEGEKASVVLHFSDDPETENFYRFTVQKGGPYAAIDHDMTVGDDLFSSSQSTLGTGAIYKKGDTLTCTLYHIDEKYYDFLQSVSHSRSANYSAFAQPQEIKSTVEGGIGVFTALRYDTETIVLK